MSKQSETIAWYTPRPWHGMSFGVWKQLLRDNHYHVSPTRMPMAAAITVVSLFNSYSRWLSELRHAVRADHTPITHAPLFVLGHWRTGTTLLHELLIRDRQYTFPSTFQCMVPHHFLRTHRLLPRLSRIFLPERRVMDNMEFGWEHPQEDEFALCNLGVPSPYLFWAFPGNRSHYDKYLTLETLTDAERENWKQVFVWFLRRMTLHDPRQLVLKSPPHTARLPILLELFPDAKFIHMTRDPRSVIPSTVRTWERMRIACGLQMNDDTDLEDYVLETFDRMYANYWRHRDELASDQLIEVRYEELIQNPLDQMERIYDQLGLDNFGQAVGRMKRYLRDVRDYQRNAFQLSEQRQARIVARCQRYMDLYGYEASSTGLTTSNYSQSSSSSSSSSQSSSSSSSQSSSSSSSSSRSSSSS